VTALRFIGILLFCALFAAPAAAQVMASDVHEELYYTFAGICAEGGFSSFKRNGWLGTRQGTVKKKGIYYAPGIMLGTYVGNMCGEFRWLFLMNSTSDKGSKINYSLYSATGKYLFKTSPLLDLTLGLGVYFEGAPASKPYNGAGGEVTAGGILNMSGESDWKIVGDIRFRYGFFGEGKSSKMNYGIAAGVTRKFGRS
jgi:hypothetical protein